MTAFDWLDLLTDAAPLLADQGWHWNDRMALRNRDGRCPLCALAALYGCSDYETAWRFALSRAFNLDKGEAYSAGEIADAADSYGLRYRSNVLFIHARLVHLFGKEGYAQPF